MIRFAELNEALDRLKARGRYRSLVPRRGNDFSSNDYLALAGSDELRAAAAAALQRGISVGSGGSRLLRGNDAEHEALEREAAAYFGTQACLSFSGGYVANMAVFSTLPDRGDLVVYDALIHASTHDGMRLGRAECRRFDHNDVGHAEALIRDWRNAGGKGRVWITFETVYSMDGDLAPLEELVALAERNDGVAVIDEAHATGVFGEQGRGLAHEYEGRSNILTLHTCGKALGVSGGLICGAALLIETLINRARGFIFATAPSPLNAALVRAALELLQSQPERRAELTGLIEHAGTEARRHDLPQPKSQIIPVIIGDDAKTMALAAALQARGFDIRGIRPPTVPLGTSRLRIAITLNVSAEVVTQMFSGLAEEMQRAGL